MRIDKNKKLSRKARRHRDAIVRAVELGISNARQEAINSKIELVVRTGYGFRNVNNLIALVLLRCSHLPIALPDAHRGPRKLERHQKPQPPVGTMRRASLPFPIIMHLPDSLEELPR